MRVNPRNRYILWIDNDRVEIKKAGHLWGKNIREAEAQIKKERNDRRVRVAAIGPAGERLVRIANIVHEERSASRTGLGAVMGSKHLKAVAIRGSKEVKLFDPEGFARLAKDMQQRIARSDKYDHFRKNGGSTGTYGTSKAGFLASRNFNQTGDFEGIENFNPRNVAPRFYLSNKPCFKCPIGCGKRWEVKDGPFAGEWGNKIEEGAFTPLGPVCGNSNVESVFKMNNMANQLGLDTIECAAGMAVVMEWYEKGIVTRKDLDGIELTWGNYNAMIQMMEKVAFRQGVGDILAEGYCQGIARVRCRSGKMREPLQGNGHVRGGFETDERHLPGIRHLHPGCLPPDRAGAGGISRLPGYDQRAGRGNLRYG